MRTAWMRDRLAEIDAHLADLERQRKDALRLRRLLAPPPRRRRRTVASKSGPNRPESTPDLITKLRVGTTAPRRAEKDKLRRGDVSLARHTSAGTKDAA